MTLYEFAVVIAVILGFAALRFGIPILLTWGLGRFLRVVARPTS